MLRTRVVGKPAQGDLDGDGDEDAVLWLLQETGGSGSFHYLAAVMREPDGYVGTTAVFLGDRLRRNLLLIDRRVVAAFMLKRHGNAPMASAPSLPERRFFIAAASGLLETGSTSDPADALVHGMLVIGHEVRSFWPCGAEADWWLAGEAAALRDVARRYESALPDAAPYTPLFAALVGQRIRPVEEGFGADYEQAFAVRALLGFWPDETC
jgi:hypothetical protein